jgi:hypothetical protein
MSFYSILLEMIAIAHHSTNEAGSWRLYGKDWKIKAIAWLTKAEGS